MLFQYGQMLVKRLHIIRDVNNDAHFCMFMLIIQVIITMGFVGLRWGWGCSLQNNKTTRSIRLRQIQKKVRKTCNISQKGSTVSERPSSVGAYHVGSYQS